MSALGHLEALLRPALQDGTREMTTVQDIDAVLNAMRARYQNQRTRIVPMDQQFDAVRRFWDNQEVATFRDAYLLSWGLCLPYRPNGPCVLEDRPRLQRVLDGVDAWTERPTAYRRCYQGLVKSYFTYDALDATTSTKVRANWELLRDYLEQHNADLQGPHPAPDWVTTALANPQLFGEDPCDPYVDAVLRGDAGAIERLCAQMGIAETSWFLRELVLAQVRGATQLDHAAFRALLPRLLALLSKHPSLRDRGLAAVLNRYAKVPGNPQDRVLRDSAVAWWGNPWLPSNTVQWGGVAEDARAMVSEWLKLEFIETFFTKLADDGMADRRRMTFWKRYVKAIGHIEFALGSTARNSTDEDFVVLRKKMRGLIVTLEAAGTNNAFIMTMGNLVAVEFSGMGNALYGYDARGSLPFDTAKPLVLSVNARNSLKHRPNIMWLPHTDGVHNGAKWEDT